MTSAITDLPTLLASMTPCLSEDEYVFCSLTVAQRRTLNAEPILEFIESEGITVVITLKQAQEQELLWEFSARMITLKVYSSLHAVGFLAAITSRLAAAGISVQPVSAFHHDYLFVPAGRAQEALEVLRQLSENNDSANQDEQKSGYQFHADRG